MVLLLSDLDGTLLDSRTYSYEPARPALEAIGRQGVPLVVVTSKTRAEVELWRRRLGNEEPFIVENGGAIYIPAGYFPFEVEGARRRDGYDVIELGTPYVKLVAALRRAVQESGCEALGFSDMSVADICRRTLLTVQQAEFAKQREYDEPFEILGPGTYRLLEAVEGLGMGWTRGDRFYHLTGGNDKVVAVARLIGLYRRAWGEVTSVGVGDGPNDVKFLNAVDLPVIVQSRYADAVRRAVPRALVSRLPGPHGWNEVVVRAISSAGSPLASGAVAREGARTV
jgi:mannosyl-3-phosphoglycerate phosphatase